MHTFIWATFYCFCLYLPQPLISEQPTLEELAESSSSDEAILKNFFSDRISSTPAGYVLYGSKPLSLETSNDEESSCIGTEQHKEACETLEVYHIWQDRNFAKNQSEHILLLSKPERHSNVTLFINRKAFLEVVSKNTTLFQSKLGIHVTAERLLQTLLDPNVDVYTLFKGNTALLGMILGYGTENSIAYERATNILKPVVSKSLLPPPYRADLPPTNPDETIKKVNNSAIDKDEITLLINSMAYPTDTYENSGTKIPFSYIKDSEESKQLLQMYVKAQSAVEKAVDSENFFEQILNKFNYPTIECKDDPYCLQNPQTKARLPSLVAAAILRHIAAVDLGNQGSNYLDCFITGMLDAEKTKSESYADTTFFDAYQILRASSPLIQVNEELSRILFISLLKQPNIIWIEPAKVGYKIIKPGTGDSLNNKAIKVSMQYLIKDIDGKILSGSFKLAQNNTIELSKLIPALVHAMQGMRKNEVREVYIHQDFAYGKSATFGDGKPLFIQVELVDMEYSQEQVILDEMIPVDLLRLIGNKTLSRLELETLRKQYMRLCGFRTWIHYKKAAHFFSLGDVLEAMHEIQNNPNSKLLQNEYDKRIVRRLDLFLYSLSGAPK